MHLLGRQRGRYPQTMSEEAEQQSRKFLEKMPANLMQPSMIHEPDGDVDLSWYADSSHVLSVSVSPTGRIAWAYIIGGETRSGSRHASDPWPETFTTIILFLIERCGYLDSLVA